VADVRAGLRSRRGPTRGRLYLRPVASQPAATLIREPLPCRLSPLRAALALRGEERPFALVGAWAGGGAILGSCPARVADPGQDLFAFLDEQPVIASRPAAAGAVGGGWFGFLGFELGRRVERLDPSPPAPDPLPVGALAYYDHLLRCDRAGRWWFEALLTPERRRQIEARRRELLSRLVATHVRPRPVVTGNWRWRPSPSAHAAMVEACRERIRYGDLFQANICLRLEGSLDGDPLDLFCMAAAALPTDRAAFVGGPWGALVSLSPELFLERRGRLVRSAPIKGTRPLDRREELLRSEKERAENVMIVDLVRNDLGRVCEVGSVRVPALAQARRHAGVWHLVSEVQGVLRPDVGDAQLLRATFPPGSVTGAPKIAALNVIAELESSRREAYTGAIGFVSPAWGLELSVTIRTFEVRGSRIWLGVGGGIVADSSPEQETAEVHAKAKPPLAAIGTEPPTRPGRAKPAPAERRLPPLAPTRRGPRPLPRPDPALGLYETILIADGAPVRLAAHIARLSASMRALYGLSPPADLEAVVRGRAAGVARGRLRIDVAPGEEPVLALTPLPSAGPAILRPVVVPGGLGAHKWRDRRLLEALEAEDPATLPLLLDADGYVLEASRAAVLARANDGRLYTPPADGRILPSITAAWSGARPRLLTLGDLAAAPEIYLASALRGLQPAALLPRARPPLAASAAA